MIKKIIAMALKWLLILLAAGGLILGMARLIAVIYAAPRTYSAATVPAARVAIVLGAGLQRDGTPTPVLRDRVATAAGLYFAGKVEKILLSGDNRFIYYNEPGAMQSYALELGVPEDALVLDYAGRRTYDTCYRARHIFGVEKAIVVTQEFHLPRAIYLCNRLGVAAVGVSANRRSYQRGPYAYWTLREMPATLVALWESNITHPLPVLGDPEPIFPPGQTS